MFIIYLISWILLFFGCVIFSYLVVSNMFKYSYLYEKTKLIITLFFIAMLILFVFGVFFLFMSYMTEDSDNLIYDRQMYGTQY